MTKDPNMFIYQFFLLKNQSHSQKCYVNIMQVSIRYLGNFFVRNKKIDKSNEYKQY